MSTIAPVDTDLEAILEGVTATSRVDDALRARIDAHVGAINEAARPLLDESPDVAAQLESLLAVAVAAWQARSLDLKVHGEGRAATDHRLSSRFTLGAACYADRYAGNLAGLRAEISALRDLGVSHLHVQAPFARHADGTSDLGRVDPGLGSIDRLSDLAGALRLAGISLTLDVALRGDIVAFARDVTFLANCGVDAFIVADPTVAAVMAPVLAIAAPGVVVLAPSPGSAPLWQSLATANAARLDRALRARNGSRDIASIRDADAVRWTADGDRLSAFYTDGSTYARGVAVPGGVAGTAASLAGIEAGDPLGEARVVLAHALALSVPGIPMLWLGDEVGQLNDDTYRDDPARRDDPRWLHRGQKPRDRYAMRTDAETSAGRLFTAITRLIAVRHTTPEFDGTRLVGFDVADSSVVAFQRPGDDTVVLVFANIGDRAASVDAVTLSGFGTDAEDMVTGDVLDLADGVELAPCGVRWLRVRPRDGDLSHLLRDSE